MKNVNACIVEYLRDNAYGPDKSILDSVLLVKRSLTDSIPPEDRFPGVSGHATEVARIFCGDWSESARGLATALQCFEATNYTGRGQLGGGKTVWLPGQPWPPFEGYKWPVLPDYAVINQSWGGVDMLWMQDILNIYDWFIDRYNLLSFVPCPNLPDEQRQGGIYAYLMSGSRNSIIVGSSDMGNCPVPGCPPMILAPNWGSFASPKVGQTGIAIASLCLERGYKYKYGEVRNWIVQNGNLDQGQDVEGKRVPLINHNGAMAAVKAAIDGVFVPAPVIPPPPPPPPLKKLRCEALTAKKTQCTRICSAIGDHFCWQHMPKATLKARNQALFKSRDSLEFAEAKPISTFKHHKFKR
jgi:hypothetical protein